MRCVVAWQCCLFPPVTPYWTTRFVTSLLQKRSPVLGQWKRRYFVVDCVRGALVYYADDECSIFKGAIPLPLITRVTANVDRCIDIDIPERSFELRLPHEAAVEERGVLLKELLDAAATHSEGTEGSDALPSNHWKVEQRYLTRKPAPDANQLSRSVHPGYPARRPPISGARDWNVALPSYDPPEFTGRAGVGRPCVTMSWTGESRMEGSVPLNPVGRTGLRGRGEVSAQNHACSLCPPTQPAARVCCFPSLRPPPPSPSSAAATERCESGGAHRCHPNR